jgi:hypothetical protein
MFQESTRRYLKPATMQTKGVTTPLRWRLDKDGILAGIYLKIRGEIAGSVAGANALGKCSIIKEVRLVINGRVDVARFSGPQYHWLIREMLEEYDDVGAHTDGRSAVALGAFTLDMFIPVAINARDMPGLLLLQNEQTEVVLTVEFEEDANVAPNAVVTATVIPELELFTVPVDKEDWPPLNIVHSLIAETQVVSGAGLVTYFWPRGNSYLQMIHGLGFGIGGADGWSQLVCRAAGNQSFMDVIPGILDGEFTRWRGRARPVGVIPVDMLGSSGLGSYGSVRDVIYSQAITNLKSEITATGAGTLHSVRRELVALE